MGERAPFIVLLLVSFAIAGGVRLKGTLTGAPLLNLRGLLAVGAVLASLMGTTGAARPLIRPYLRISAHRKYRVHNVVFFIYLAANIGGSLSPSRRTPLLLGFLKGVAFFWTTVRVWQENFILAVWLFCHSIHR
ncbi:MAG: sodium:proton antiporter [Deltaproteobacteria bacterium]|nr:sodium:proton antiporter [Deltaproteobacteria bacterium]